MSLHPDDPRLTDYALGELSPAERAELERELAESADAREALAEIERATGLIGAALAEEDQPALDAARRAAILAEAPTPDGAPAVATLPGHWRGMTTGRWISAVVAAGLSGVILTAITMQAMHDRQDVAVGRQASNDELSAAIGDYEKIGRVATNFQREQESLLQDSINPQVVASAAESRAAASTTPLATMQGASGPQPRRELETETKQLDHSTTSPHYVHDDVGYAPGEPRYTVSKPVYEQSRDGQEPLAYPDREAWRRMTKFRAIDAAGGKALQKNAATGGTTTLQDGQAQPTDGEEFVDELHEQIQSNPSAYVNGGYTWNVENPETQTFTGETSTTADLYSARGGQAYGRLFREGGLDGATPPADFDQLRQLHDLTVAEGMSSEAYAPIVENVFKSALLEPMSTFSIDVDTASYSNVRRFLTQNSLPPPGAVRLEEMINYFSYEYAQPTGEDPFAVHVEVAQCPWEAKHRLVRIGLAGRELAIDKRPSSNLVFLIDVSGSMQDANKLTLVKTGLRLLTEQLSENDRVAMVVYAGSSGQVLASTPGNQKETILAALDQLEAGGSTNGAGGIEQAYQVAVENFQKGGVNRVILCTDGDFNVGVTDESQLVSLIEGKAKTGVFLSVLGFGMGNLKDSTLEKLSDKGNGNYAYIDTEREARKVLVEQLSGTLVTIAKDVKVQLEFNPARTAAYRLIGYENRLLAKEDFNDDTKDAGEIGAGHTVTALYEVIPAGEPSPTATVDALEYQVVPGPTEAAKQSRNLFTLKLRYKQPNGDTSKLLVSRVEDSDRKIGEASADYQFAASVAAFGMLLRHSPHAAKMNYGAVLELAQPGLSQDKEGYRAEFVELVRKAQELSGAK